MKIYSKENCSRCKLLKRWLESKRIDFEEVDVEKDSEALDKLISANRRSLPVVEIDGEFVDFDEYNDLLKKIK